jgi:YVTN family beta-propeller protein
LKEPDVSRQSLRLAITGALVSIVAAMTAASQSVRDDVPGAGVIVVANRGSGSISVIGAASRRVLGTFPLPADPHPAEPMYVVDGGSGRVLVGDRGNNRVVAFDRGSFQPVRVVPAGAGVFHMWASEGNQQLWVNNDVDNTATVIDLRTLNVIATVPMPADLVAQGGRPHDVVLDPHHGRFAYITMIGVNGPDYVIKFSTQSFEEVDRAPVGEDPHLSLDDRHEQLFVPCQGSNLLLALDAGTLNPLAALSVPGAHGAGMLAHRNRFYTTNFPGDGIAALFTIDTRSLSGAGARVDTPLPMPHNVAFSGNGHKLFLTHSGPAADQVSAYDLDPSTGLPVLDTTVTVGINPFGIAFVR